MLEKGMKRPLPHYRHINQVPEGMVTRLQLSREGLQTAGAPVATLSHGGKNRQRTELFWKSDAIPKRKPSDQEMHIWKAEQERQHLQDQHMTENERLEWCSRALHDLLQWSSIPPAQWVTLDTETTDLMGEAISIGVVSGTGDVLLDQLVKPQTAISDEAFRVHGISEASLQEQPNFAEVMPELQAVLQGKTIFAFNADFDRSTLIRSARRSGFEHPEGLFPASAWHCLMVVSSALFGEAHQKKRHGQDFQYLSLQKARQKVASALGEQALPYRAHSSLGDAQATHELALWLFKYADSHRQI